MTDKYYKSSDQVLAVSHNYDPTGWGNTRYNTYIFDFEFRTMSVDAHSSQGTNTSTVMPFSQVDAEVLERMHAKLVELGGKPDPLPGTTVPKLSARPAAKGLNP